MSSNALGQLFKITTWGESHGKAIGVVIDGCPAGIAISDEMIWEDLKKRAPGLSELTSPRKESDKPEILSGVFEGKTTGTPISIIIYNHDVNSSHYEPIKDLLRPGHAQFSYLAKYGVYDYRGGGRASARETACRVAAASIAKKILEHHQIKVTAKLCQVGEIGLQQEHLWPAYLEQVREAGDSLGGIVAFSISGAPPGLGSPLYEKLEANLAKAMLSIPASKGFEIGQGFDCTKMTGSLHNDTYSYESGEMILQSNHAGGILGGISTGLAIEGKVAFKPTSSIGLPQNTVNLEGEKAVFKLPEGSRHDPCVAIRAVAVVEAMCALVMVDALLMHRMSRL